MHDQPDPVQQAIRDLLKRVLAGEPAVRTEQT